jgi:hypothetical protein
MLLCFSVTAYIDEQHGHNADDGGPPPPLEAPSIA